MVSCTALPTLQIVSCVAESFVSPYQYLCCRLLCFPFPCGKKSCVQPLSFSSIRCLGPMRVLH